MLSGKRLDVLPVTTHVGPLQIIVPERHLARIASIFIGLCGCGHRNRLRAMICRSAGGYGSHVTDEKLLAKEAEKDSKKKGSKQ